MHCNSTPCAWRSRCPLSTAAMNALLFSALLILLGPSIVLLPLAAAATIITGLRWLWAALLTLREPDDGEPLYTARTLLPGLFALVLSALGLYIAAGRAVDEPLFYAGIGLYAIELAFLAVAADDLFAARNHGKG